jgi:hypothetical protein
MGEGGGERMSECARACVRGRDKKSQYVGNEHHSPDFLNINTMLTPISKQVMKELVPNASAVNHPWNVEMQAVRLPWTCTRI